MMGGLSRRLAHELVNDRLRAANARRSAAGGRVPTTRLNPAARRGGPRSVR
jgi:hypothetical protein